MKRAFISKTFAVSGAMLATVAMLASGAWRAAGARQATAAPTGGKAPQASTAKISTLVKRPPGLRGEIQRELDEAETKLVSLASAVPPEKFSWRPAPGVRSFGEVFLHVAGVNYQASSFWGAKPPAGVDLQKIEQQGADKGNAVAAMRISFETMRASIAAMPDSDLERQISFYGRQSTVRAALLSTATHAHEHLGQAIAYARANGITPPWSAGGNM